MLKKIAFICGSPLVKLSIDTFETREREYYEWLCQMAEVRSFVAGQKEIMEVYGEPQSYDSQRLFEDHREGVQMLFVQSRCNTLLQKVFFQADLVVMELPEQRKKFDPIFMSIFPWKDEILFLWDTQKRQGTSFLKQFCREYQLREGQIIPVKRDLDGKLKISW